MVFHFDLGLRFMNPNKGKKSYSSFDKAFADAKAMRRNKGERFTQYKDERTNVWHVGSNVLGKRDNKIAEEDLNQNQIYKLLQDQIDDETYAQINSFESDVRTTLEEGATNTVNGGVVMDTYRFCFKNEHRSGYQEDR